MFFSLTAKQYPLLLHLILATIWLLSFVQVYSSSAFLFIISSFSRAFKAISNLSLSDFFVIFNDLHYFLYSRPSEWLRLSIIDDVVNMISMKNYKLIKFYTLHYYTFSPSLKLIIFFVLIFFHINREWAYKKPYTNNKKCYWGYWFKNYFG